MRLIVFAWLFAICQLQCAAVEPQFSVDVMSVLSKAGCNAGTCHGNLNGKGGFKLSLRGQDPKADFEQLTRASRGRRVNFAAPDQSLFLQKATGHVPHVGGMRFGVDSWEYKELLRWMQHGAVGPRSGDRRLVALRVQPESAVVVAPTDDIQITVLAEFADGQKEDITHRACYELSNLNAEVEPSGRVVRKRFGETNLIVRYLDQQVPVSIAFTEAKTEFQWQSPVAKNFVDHHVFSKLRDLRVNLSAECNDSVFVRRVYLDAIGRMPTAAEAREFLANQSPNKRAETIEQLLNRPEFADYWAIKYADILRVEEKVLDPQGVELFHGWIRETIEQGLPLNQFVRALLTTTGSTFDNPAANFYRANRDPSTRGETTARLFLGTRLQCAKCHNHPYDRWTQDDYYQWANIFSQLEYEEGENKRKDELDKNEFAGEQIVLVKAQAEVRNPSTGKMAPPKFLGGPELIDEAKEDRLGAVADWLTSDGNDLFVQSQVNFVWFHVMGRGLVDPVDDFRITNPPSNRALLDALATEFVAQEFDLRSLVKAILSSRTYEAASDPLPSNRNDETNFARTYIRRYPAEVLLDMQSDFLELPAEFAGFEAGVRAIQLPGVEKVRRREQPAKAGDRFLTTFGKPQRILACECERSNETNLKQVLGLVGADLDSRLADSPRLKGLAQSVQEPEQVIEELFLAALARYPSESEIAAGIEAVDRDGRAIAFQDLSWALLNAKEFLFRR